MIKVDLQLQSDGRTPNIGIRGSTKPALRNSLILELGRYCRSRTPTDFVVAAAGCLREHASTSSWEITCTDLEGKIWSMTFRRPDEPPEVVFKKEVRISRFEHEDVI
jgi:acyl-coenzyme A thioesterase PaaI-like protein